MNGYLGQNFLIDKKKIKKIVDVLDLKSNDTVIEIGAGHGEITKEIIERLKDLKIERFKIVAVEKDARLIEIFKKNLRVPNVEIVKGDALKILPKIISNLSIFQSFNYKLVGNIPFYITGCLLRIISELKLKPDLAVFIIQKEVAQRICVKPPQMNLLAASVGFWAEPKIIGYISKKEFKPAPEVDAAIIKLRIKNYELGIMDNYYKFIRVLFKQPRKTILNNLILSIKYQELKIKSKEGIIKKLQKAGINLSDRAQNLTIEQIKNLSKSF